MSKWLLMIFACVILTVDGQEELRKEVGDAGQPHLHSAQPSDSNTENQEETHEREKRMPEAKRSEDGSFGYAWNVGNGVSYMKIHIGKNNKNGGTDTVAAAQQEVINSLREGGQDYLQNHKYKTGYQKLHSDYQKTRQQMVPYKNQNLGTRPTIVNQNIPISGKQEFNFKDKNFASFAFNKEENKGIKGSHLEFQEFHDNLKHIYNKFNQDAQYSGWPQQQDHSLKESDIAQNLKSLESSRNGNYKSVYAEGNIDSRPLYGIENQEEFLKSLENQKNFANGGNWDGMYKSIELPMQVGDFATNDFAETKEANFQGFNQNENSFKYAGQQNPMIFVIEQKHNSDIVSKSIGEIQNTENKEQHIASNEYHRSPENAWSTQNVVSNHHSKIEDTDYKSNFEESKKAADGENIQKALSETPYNPEIATDDKEGQFQIHAGSTGEENYSQTPNDFGNGVYNGMHAVMNPELINDQVERIKQIQQKVIESQFPGPGIYTVLDGNTQHRFSFQGYPMLTQNNIGPSKQDEYNSVSESNTGLAHDLNNYREGININFQEERHIPNDNTVRFGYSNGNSNRQEIFINNNAPNHKLNPNQFSGEHELVNDESMGGVESYNKREEETLWRPQRNSIKPKNEHHIDHKNGTYDTEKSMRDEPSKGYDERKGREIKSDLEQEDAVHLDDKETHEIEDDKKDHFYGSEEQSHAGIGYPQFQQFSQQEPQIRVITKAIPIHKELKIPVPQMVRHPIMIPVPYKVLEPYPIHIPVPVPVEKTVEVPVEKVIRYPVEKPVPVKVVKEVKVPVPKPYPVKVPVYKTKYVHHYNDNNKKKKHE